MIGFGNAMTILNSFDLLVADRERLVAAAVDAQSNAYCPYSNFPVGAAVLANDGHLFKGCNVENASYGLTTCAERNAIAAAVAAGYLNIVAIAVVTDAPTIARPCGACRQVIAEFSSEEHSTTVISISSNGEAVVETINDLLPGRFNLL
jgi:cytidine deaminase